MTGRDASRRSGVTWAHALSLALVWAFAAPITAVAQRIPLPDTTLSGLFQLDFSAPEAPAFNLLEVNESNLLRPGTVRELSVALSQFTGSELFLPKSFSVEFAPALLMSGRDLTRAKYKEMDWLYRLRVSAATQRVDETSRATRVAFGVRTTLVDGADLRTNADAEDYADFVTGLAASLAGSKQAFQDQIQSEFDLGPGDALSNAIDTLFAGNAGRAVVLFQGAGLTAEQAQDVARRPAGDAGEFDARIERRRKELQEKNWNATVIEIAYAVRAEAADSAGKDLSFDRHGFWLTAGFPLGDWGQLLVGSELGVTRDTITTDYDGRGSLGSRLYWGGNTLKFFVEVEADWTSGRKTELLLNSGGELRPNIGGWVTFSAGLNRDPVTSDYDLVTDFRWSFPFDPIGGS